MNRKTLTLALSGAIACLSFIPPAAADVTYYEGTREALREFCKAQHGDIIETTSKTRCTTVVGIIICKSNGMCQRQDSITVLSQEAGNGGSISSGGGVTAAPPMIEKLHAL